MTAGILTLSVISVNCASHLADVGSVTLIECNPCLLIGYKLTGSLTTDLTVCTDISSNYDGDDVMVDGAGTETRAALSAS